MLQNYIQILQLQTSPDQFLMILIKGKTVLLLLITSDVLFQSMLPLNDITDMTLSIISWIMINAKEPFKISIVPL